MYLCKKIFASLAFFLILGFLTVSCVEKETDPNDPQAAFLKAREPYDDELYEIATQKLGEFKSRFPYSKHTPDAELMIADSHFQLRQFAEAAAAYELFVRLHPRHEKASFAQFRVGESYWSESSDSIDREQDSTLKAISEWEKLLSNYPKSEELDKTKGLLEQGRRRVAEHLNFIASFYCKQEIYHACAYRFLQLIEKYPQFQDLIKNAYEKAALAFEKMSKLKGKDEQSDANLYFKEFNAEQLKKRAEELSAKAKAS